MTVAGVIVALSDGALVVVSWRSRSVLSGILGFIGIPLVAFALLAGSNRQTDEQVLLVAAGALVLGIALFALGRALERLLNAEPRDGT